MVVFSFLVSVAFPPRQPRKGYPPNSYAHVCVLQRSGSTGASTHGSCWFSCWFWLVVGCWLIVWLFIVLLVVGFLVQGSLLWPARLGTWSIPGDGLRVLPGDSLELTNWKDSRSICFTGRSQESKVGKTQCFQFPL